MVQHKLGCFSHQVQELLTCPWRIRSQTPVGSCTGADGTVHYGITVGNVPIGTSGFVQVKLRAKADEIVRYVAETVQHASPQLCLTQMESRSGASLAAQSATRILTPSVLRLTAFAMGIV